MACYFLQFLENVLVFSKFKSKKTYLETALRIIMNIFFDYTFFLQNNNNIFCTNILMISIKDPLLYSLKKYLNLQCKYMAAKVCLMYLKKFLLLNKPVF